MNQEEIDMITWRINRDEFLIKERQKTMTTITREEHIWLSRDEGFVAGLKWVRDGDMQKCILDVKAGLADISSKESTK